MLQDQKLSRLFDVKHAVLRHLLRALKYIISRLWKSKVVQQVPQLPKVPQESKEPRLPSDLQDEIIRLHWNLRLSPLHRKIFISSAVCVNIQWRKQFLQCAFQDFYFSSGEIYQWYSKILKIRETRGHLAALKDCQFVTTKFCRSVNLTYNHRIAKKYAIVFNNCMFHWLDIDLHSKQNFPNLCQISIDSVNLFDMGPKEWKLRNMEDGGTGIKGQHYTNTPATNISRSLSTGHRWTMVVKWHDGICSNIYSQTFP
ncbi:hypothetical protein BDQ17DRAFT_676005 [Cyathus striatus]|nr:hypothetical protein BDQ17DRAFT_676005 [Cyathus striatus]